MQFLMMLFVVCLLSTTTLYAQKNIKGQVIDSSGMEVIGASVQEKGSGNGTITDMEGKFELKLSSTDGTIIVSFIGYITQELKAGNQNFIKVILKEDTQQLEEVVVTALGIKRDKKALGYAVSNVEGNNLSAFPK